MREPDESDKPNDVKSGKASRLQGDPPPRQEQIADNKFHLDPDLQIIEAAWSRLRPDFPQIDRDRLMYQAGWAAAETALTERQHGRSRRLAWPVAPGGMTAIAATLLGMLLLRPEPGVVERVVYVPSNRDGMATDAARAFAQSNAGASAADGQEPGVWTAGQWLRAAAAGSSQLASDLLPKESTLFLLNSNPWEEQIVLSTRSFDSLLEFDPRGKQSPAPPDCQLPTTQESSHDL